MFEKGFLLQRIVQGKICQKERRLIRRSFCAEGKHCVCGYSAFFTDKRKNSCLGANSREYTEGAEGQKNIMCSRNLVVPEFARVHYMGTGLIGPGQKEEKHG